MTALQRFNKYTRKTRGCWHWKGHLGAGGYGGFRFRGGTWKAHRASYTMFVGEIPSGLELDHLCRVRSCVNPRHLEAVTKRENMLRGESPPAKNARKKKCFCGNKYSMTRKGRKCLRCTREHNRIDVRNHRLNKETATLTKRLLDNQ